MDVSTTGMKALILAAGLGTRLKPITNQKPKSLVPVNGKPIIMKQIENLHSNGIYSIVIVSGYKAGILERTIHESYPEIQIIESINYAATNNMYSAYLARNIIGNHAFLMMNADVFFDVSVISSLVTCEAPNAIATDIGNYFEESMKVVEKNGRLVRISKTITLEEALGSSIDVYKFSAEGGNAFLKKCTDYIEKKKEVKMWSEVALNDILSVVEFKACPITGRWLEIDNHDDLAAAERLFKEE